MSHLRCLLRMSEECLLMHAPIILQKPFTTNVLQGMVLQPEFYYYSFIILYSSPVNVSYIQIFMQARSSHSKQSVYSSSVMFLTFVDFYAGQKPTFKAKYKRACSQVPKFSRVTSMKKRALCSVEEIIFLCNKFLVFILVHSLLIT